MKKVNGLLGVVFIGATVALSLNSCNGTYACHEDNISAAGSSKSHNKGQNCMVCHQAKGEGETVLIDSKGNFYTTADFSPVGLYPVVTGPTGNKKMMGSALSTGACNSCHGSSTDKLWVD